jgi:hypothetical protein
VLLAVADAGPGLPTGMKSGSLKIFQATPGSTRGVGLGLSICRSIIEVHGGRIWVANRPEGGAVFSFTLPLEEGTTVGPGFAESKKIRTMKLRILLIEDDPQIRRFTGQSPNPGI